MEDDRVFLDGQPLGRIRRSHLFTTKWTIEPTEDTYASEQHRPTFPAQHYAARFLVDRKIALESKLRW